MGRPNKELIEKRNQLILEGFYLCGRCSEVKPLLEFGRHAAAKHGIQANCKTCTNARNVDYVKKAQSEMGREAFLARKKGQLDKWKKNTRPKRIEHFKRKEREANLRANYGMTIHDFDVMLAEQDGRCAICMTPNPQRKWHVDHCHDSGEVRGILCNLCNVAIGAFKENPDAIAMSLIYLRPRGKITPG